MMSETISTPETLDLIVGWAVHDLTTSIIHKAKTPGRLDEDCAVLGQAIAGRIAAGRPRFESAIGAERNVGLVHEHGPLSWTEEGWRCDLCGEAPVVITP